LTTDRPVRVLHVLGRLQRGGVETWLMRSLRRIDRDRMRFDFLVHSPDAGDYDDEARALGARIIWCPTSAGIFPYARQLMNILRTLGPFDVVHSHVHHFSGVVLAVAALARVPARIAHSHSSAVDDRPGWRRRLYLRTTHLLLRAFATRVFAASKTAATSLCGPKWTGNDRCTVLHCGIDIAPFRSRPPQADIRQELGIAPDAFVIGHVGRFVPEKNHSFLIDLLGAAAALHSNAQLVLVGSGPTEELARARAAAQGLTPRVHFLGPRDDIGRLLPAFDVFAMPSLREGLGLAAVEAQAAGVAVLLASAIPREAIVDPSLCRVLDLAEGPAAWAQAALAEGARPRAPDAGIEAVEHSSFNLERSLVAMVAEYERPPRRRDSPS
jgi:glycosyltransferase involved in cell wall biosynthesis